jgi:hypothetical protein
MVRMAASPQRSWQVAPAPQASEQAPEHCTRQLEPLVQVVLPPAPMLMVQLAPVSHSMRAEFPAVIVQLLFS